MGIHEIVLPEATPAFEWVNGRALQKLSPRRKHALAQGRFFAALDGWATEHRCGLVGTEWECCIGPVGAIRRPLVPDVAYLSYARLPYDQIEDADIPRIAPDAVVEIISPGDDTRDIDDKVHIYLNSGTSVVFLVDTRRRQVTIRDRHGSELVGVDGIVIHPSLDGFSLRTNMLFFTPKPG